MGDYLQIGAKVTKIAENTFHTEQPCELKDGGYTAECGWSDEDEAWVARLRGIHCGDCLGTGPSRIGALLDLAIALGNTIDTFAPPPRGLGPTHA